LTASGRWMSDLYLWVKVLHILAVVSWMAGLFYLPRIYVYHADNKGELCISGLFVVMERRLLWAIMRPAGVVSIGSGGVLVWLGNWSTDFPTWLWIKIGLVLGMGGFHGLLEVHAWGFAKGRDMPGSRYFRLINEIPTVLLIGIVTLVVVKPF
jgi:putative membrane protein